MAAVLDDLGDVQLVGEDADAVLVGGADETEETNRVFSYMNLARAFAELELGPSSLPLHKNRWWQTSAGRCSTPVASSRASSTRPTSRRPWSGSRAPSTSPPRSRLDADAEMTWMVGDDIEADVAGAQQHGLKTARPHGEVPPRRGRARHGAAGRDPLLDRGLSRLAGERVTRVGVDMIEIGRIREALERYTGFRDRCFTAAEQAYCDARKNPAQHYAARFAGKEAVGKALGLGVARLFAWRDIEIAGRPKPSVTLSGRVEQWAERVEAGPIDLSMSHSRELASAVCGSLTDVFEPFYTADEMRAAEEGHDVEELMRRAGAAVAEEVLRRFPDGLVVRRGLRRRCKRRRRSDRSRAPPRSRLGGARTRRGRRRDRRAVRHRLPAAAARRCRRADPGGECRRKLRRGGGHPVGRDARPARCRGRPSMPQSPSRSTGARWGSGWLREVQGRRGRRRGHRAGAPHERARAYCRRSSGWFRGEGQETRSTRLGSALVVVWSPG